MTIFPPTVEVPFLGKYLYIKIVILQLKKKKIKKTQSWASMKAFDCLTCWLNAGTEDTQRQYIVNSLTGNFIPVCILIKESFISFLLH